MCAGVGCGGGDHGGEVRENASGSQVVMMQGERWRVCAVSFAGGACVTEAGALSAGGRWANGGIQDREVVHHCKP